MNGLNLIRNTFQFPPLREGRRIRPADKSCVKHFNSRPCARGDAARPSARWQAENFNSRPCARGDRITLSASPMLSISIPAPARGATPSAACWGHCCRFQFPPLREGRRAANPGPDRQGVDFNSRPCARGDCYGINGVLEVPISIPAPARGATLTLLDIARIPFISIPAPARGATRAAWKRLVKNLFQFPPLREGRHSAHPIARHISLFQFPPLREGRHERR